MLHPALNASVNTINDERKCLPNDLLYGNISKGVISVKVTLVNISRRIHWPTIEIEFEFCFSSHLCQLWLIRD